jgi:glucokinase
MRGLFDHVSYEHVCSGIGLPHLYRYLQQADEEVESPAVARCLAESADPVRLIVAAALDPATPDPLCAATVGLFAEILGAEAGNLALKVLATGGIYLAGGLAVHTLPELAGATFARAFRDKGRMSAVLGTVPIHVVLAHAALIGAAAHGLALVDG